METVTHKFLKGEVLEDRQYQSNISKACLEQSTLVILPTGMGKTVIALRVILPKFEQSILEKNTVKNLKNDGINEA